jgi:hypothetical protein
MVKGFTIGKPSPGGGCLSGVPAACITCIAIQAAAAERKSPELPLSHVGLALALQVLVAATVVTTSTTKNRAPTARV